jgi:hypothetical protein
MAKRAIAMTECTPQPKSCLGQEQDGFQVKVALQISDLILSTSSSESSSRVRS